MTLTLETSLEIRGQLMSLPAGAHAPSRTENCMLTFFTVIGAAVGDKEAITNKVQQDADPQTLLDNRHLVLRGENAARMMQVRVRASLLRAFRAGLPVELRCLEVTPPAIVQTSVEGGSTLFRLPVLRTDSLPHSVLSALPRNLPPLHWATSSASVPPSAPRKLPDPPPSL